MRRVRGFVWAALVVLALSGSLALAGCTGTGGGGAKADDSAKLEGLWQADEVLVGTSMQPAVNVTAEFKGGMVSGSGGVNRYNGSYKTSSGNTIEFGKIASTMMAGPQDLMDVEQAYFAALGKAASFDVSATKLELKADDGTVLVSYSPLKPTTLTGTKWVCTAYNNGKQAVVGVIETSTITAEFSADEKLSGDAGVNSYNTTYQADQGEIKISAAIITTKMAGPQDLMDQEAAYLAALPQATKYRIDGDQLELRDANDAMIALYTAEK